MENILIFQEGSGTIRQMPQNYCIASNEKGRWILDPDAAADRKLVDRVYNALFEHSTKFGTGLNLLSKVTPNSEFDNKELGPMDMINIEALDNGWGGLSDIIFNCEQRRTILSTIENGLEKWENQH